MHQTSEAAVEGGKSAFNTTIDTTSRLAHGAVDKTSEVTHNVWDGTKSTAADVAHGVEDVAAAGAQKTGQAWEGKLSEHWSNRDINVIFRNFIQAETHQNQFFQNLYFE